MKRYTFLFLFNINHINILLRSSDFSVLDTSYVFQHQTNNHFPFPLLVDFLPFFLQIIFIHQALDLHPPVGHGLNVGAQVGHQDSIANQAHDVGGGVLEFLSVNVASEMCVQQAIRPQDSIFYGIWIKQSSAMIFTFNLDKVLLKTLFPTVNI